MRSTLARLIGYGGDAVVVGMPPQGQPVDCAITRPPPADCGRVVYTMADRSTANLSKLSRRAVAQFPGKAFYVPLDDVLCPARGVCPAVIDGLLARYDGIHETATFSRRIVPMIIARAEREGASFRQPSR